MYIGTILIDSDDFPYGFRYTPTHNNFFLTQGGWPTNYVWKLVRVFRNYTNVRYHEGG